MPADDMLAPELTFCHDTRDESHPAISVSSWRQFHRLSHAGRGGKHGSPEGTGMDSPATQDSETIAWLGRR